MFSLWKNLGLTLIESLIALSIVIIITIATVPVFITLYQKHHLTSYTQDLYYTLQYARSEAIANNQAVYVNFQTGDNWCYGVNIGSTCSCAIANNCNRGITTAPRTEDLSLSTAGLSGSTLVYEGTHGASNSTSTITFTLYGQTLALSLKTSPLGNTQFCSSTLSGYNACS